MFPVMAAVSAMDFRGLSNRTCDRQPSGEVCMRAGVNHHQSPGISYSQMGGWTIWGAPWLPGDRRWTAFPPHVWCRVLGRCRGKRIPRNRRRGAVALARRSSRQAAPWGGQAV